MSSPNPLPTARTFLTSLINSLPAHPAVATPAENPLNSVPESAKKQLLTLHVLFPNEFLPALDLLDRRLVTRFRIRGKPVEESGGESAARSGVVQRADQEGKESEELGLGSEGGIGSVGEKDAMDRVEMRAKDSDIDMLTGGTFNTTTSKHGIDEHGELSAEGDENLHNPDPDPILQTKAPQEQNPKYSHNPQSQEQSSNPDPHLQASEHQNPNPPNPTPNPNLNLPNPQPGTSPNPPPSPPPAQTIYYVHTSQTRPTRFPATSITTTHEVRLNAWNCTCPAFAFSAFPSIPPSTHPPTNFTLPQLSHLPIPAETQPADPWLFGGTTLGTGIPPICKHLLACVLVDKVGVFGNFVEERCVCGNEGAGWAAGWGD